MTALDALLALGIVCYLTGRSRWLRTLADRIRSRSHGGAGASAAARARQLRTPTVRIADRLGIPTQRGAQAARWAAGAEGERRTAARLTALEREGWTVLHDRALPGSRANVDHLAVSPAGVVLVPDTKRWSARWPVTVRSGRLYHGDLDVTDRLRGLRHEADTVTAVLGTPAVPVVLMDRAALAGGPLEVDGIRIVSVAQACQHLREIARTRPGHPQPAQLAARAARCFPPYRQGHR
ncbi:nuclease-related domain-containing protein [Streptomyces sp. NPDC088337]|uniref:nuclease-related domain-containing protein n=1 Tax=unclassified Streptomyces TaxID=2593676 RepID=UPI00381CA0F5